MRRTPGPLLPSDVAYQEVTPILGGLAVSNQSQDVDSMAIDPGAYQDEESILQQEKQCCFQSSQPEAG